MHKKSLKTIRSYKLPQNRFITDVSSFLCIPSQYLHPYVLRKKHKTKIVPTILSPMYGLKVFEQEHGFLSCTVYIIRQHAFINLIPMVNLFNYCDT